jgi:microcystin-dependent protein
MADPFLAEIRIFPFNFAPKGWAFCNGQILPISQNTALFALLGTIYGGDGKSTFALPDLQGSAPIHTGNDRLNVPWDLGQMGGTESVTLLLSEIPFHSHNVAAAEEPSTLLAPAPDRVLGRSDGGEGYLNPVANLTPMAPEALAPNGGSLPHNNMQPYLTLNFNIALQGVFPQRP